MFSNLIFIIIVLLSANFVFDLDPRLWDSTPSTGVAKFCLLYFALLLVIYLNVKVWRKLFRFSKKSLSNFMNVFIIFTLVLGEFAYGPHRILNEIPFIAPFDSLKALFLISFYFFALGFYYFISHSGPIKKRIEAGAQAVIFLLPFVIPFFLITLFFDLLDLFLSSSSGEVSNPSAESEALVLFSVVLLFMIFMILFLPPVIIKIWKCNPLEDSPLKERLDALCKKANFRHAGIYEWSIMHQYVTAAIIGVLPRFRYILFTRRLLNDLAPEAIEAVLVHEMGHNYRKHLLIFPFIFLGMPVSMGIVFLFFGEGVNSWFRSIDTEIVEAKFMVLAYSVTLFMGSILVICLYYRYVFGLFSRLFERQADLHGFKLGLDPNHMIRALQDISHISGIPQTAPNWHHYSIKQRVDYLKVCIEDPEKIEAHHKRTRRYLCGYCIILFLSLLLLLWP